MEQSLLSRSNDEPKLFTFTEYMIPSNKEIYKQIKKVTDFNKKILFEVTANSAFYLLDKELLTKNSRNRTLLTFPTGYFQKTHTLYQMN